MLHRAEPLGISTGLRTHALTQIITDDQVPRAEDLGGQELVMLQYVSSFSSGQWTRSCTFPWRMNRQVVPEKYDSAISFAQLGYQTGSRSAGLAALGSGGYGILGGLVHGGFLDSSRSA